MGRRLYVGNLPYSTTDQDLTTLFSQVGTVENVRVMRDMATGRARGFGFVQMATDAEAEKAISEFHEFQMQGRPLIVNEAKPKPEFAAGAGRGFGRGGGGDYGGGAVAAIGGGGGGGRAPANRAGRFAPNFARNSRQLSAGWRRPPSAAGVGSACARGFSPRRCGASLGWPLAALPCACLSAR